MISKIAHHSIDFALGLIALITVVLSDAVLGVPQFHMWTTSGIPEATAEPGDLRSSALGLKEVSLARDFCALTSVTAQCYVVLRVVWRVGFVANSSVFLQKRREFGPYGNGNDGIGWPRRTAQRQHNDCIEGAALQRTMSKPLTNPWLAPERLSLMLLPITGLAVAFALLPVGASNYDMTKFFVPWMNTVQDRGLASLSGDFAGYTPPYIYLMYLASWLVPWVGTVAAIKLINLPFIAILSLAIYHIVLIASESRERAAIAAALLWIAPTPLVNAFAWGQFECLYAAFLALFVLFAIKRAPIAAASMFGVSFAFKPQAIFLLPVLLYLILAKQMRVWHLVFVPAMYLLLMVPAAIAGFRWLDLVNSVYVAPFEAFSVLAVDAPNPWKIVGGLQLVDYRTGLLVGMAAAGVAGLLIAVGTLRLERNARTLVLVAALSGALMPYLLPKMHDRYFFVADVMTLTLAFVIPRLWAAAALFQVGSLLSYLPYFGVSIHGPIYAILPVTFGLGILTLAYVSAQVASTVRLRDLVYRFGRPACERAVESVT